MLLQLREEHAAHAVDAIATGSTPQPPPPLSQLPYTSAVVRETLRLAQIVAYVPRVATRALPPVAPGKPGVPAGCPFLAVYSAIADADPTVKGSESTFAPERWLSGAGGVGSKPTSSGQYPFGMGTHYCIGSNLALTEMSCVIAELAQKYDLAADVEGVTWRDFPVKIPSNGLPVRLTPWAPPV